MKRIAFVTQRCGEEIVGGAEALCLAIAERASMIWGTDVTILTTCARDYRTWKNEYPPGHARARGVHVIRFPVDRPRDPSRHDRASRRLLANPSLHADLAAQEEWMREQGPMSSELERYVLLHAGAYDAFVFFGYLYATTYFILPLVADKATLVPAAHDEWPIHLPMWDEFFERPRSFVFNTPEERTFLRRRFGSHVDGMVGGAVPEPPAVRDGARFRERYNIDEPFVLYLGRLDESKGCAELIQYFTEMREREPAAAPLRLVLAGEGPMHVDETPGVLAVGRISEEEKWDALEACQVLAMLSPYESLSLAVLEAWSCERPVIVSARATALVGQCRRAQGGLWISDSGEFEAAMRMLDEPTRRRLGRQGRLYIERRYAWQLVIDAYMNAL